MALITKKHQIKECLSAFVDEGRGVNSSPKEESIVQ
jgi:hypothetical protein